MYENPYQDDARGAACFQKAAQAAAEALRGGKKAFWAAVRVYCEEYGYRGYDDLPYHLENRARSAAAAAA